MKLIKLKTVSGWEYYFNPQAISYFTKYSDVATEVKTVDGNEFILQIAITELARILEEAQS